MSSSITPADPKGDILGEEFKLKLGPSISSGAITLSPEQFEKVESGDALTNIVSH